MSPIDRKVRKRAKAKAKAKAQAEAKAKAKAKTEAEAKAKAKTEAIAKAKAMFSRSNQSENPAFRALVDKLREYGDVNMVYETVDFADDIIMW
ncbi:hypothetical protein M0R45_032376 [Rubus argutus]|uniref:Uncharacterized protein n=1 Tax=Rubus argutus TaxID=59490 RepID=A0AAW1WK95_RUBAR